MVDFVSSIVVYLTISLNL